MDLRDVRHVQEDDDEKVKRKKRQFANTESEAGCHIRETNKADLDEGIIGKQGHQEGWGSPQKSRVHHLIHSVSNGHHQRGVDEGDYNVLIKFICTSTETTPYVGFMKTHDAHTSTHIITMYITSQNSAQHTNTSRRLLLEKTHRSTISTRKDAVVTAGTSSIHTFTKMQGKGNKPS